MERMQLLEDAIQSVKAYTKHPNGWRPGLVDIWIYDILIDMHESDYESVEWQEFIWRKTPDEVMQHILDTYYLFDDLEYGPEQLHEAISDVRHDLTP